MYISLILALLIGVAVPTATDFFHTPSRNLQRLTSDVRDRSVGVTLCPECIDESVYAINVLLNEILDQGILGDCSKLCGALQNKTGSTVLADVCLLACDGLGLDEFIHLILRVDLDPIWYCEIAKLCPVNDHGDAKFTHFGVLPATGPQGTTFVIDCSFKTLNGTGTSMLRVDIMDPQNQTSSNDYLIESMKPGTYTERLGVKTLTAMNCDPSQGYCDSFPVGTYTVLAQFCNGECGSHHPHSATYDVGKGSFTVTKK